MNEELQLKLQAYCDGELAGHNAGEVEAWLAKDPDARALLAELQNTRAALRQFGDDLTLPAPRDFYWSKIQREIRRQENRRTDELPVPWLAALRRFLMPAGAVAAALLGVFLVGEQLRQNDPSRAADMEVAFSDSDTFTYRDFSSGTTLVWLSYPAEIEFAEPDPGDILD